MSTTFLKRNQFKTLYGERTYAIAKNVETLYQKKMKVEEHIQFLKECKQYNVIPKGLHLKHKTQYHKNHHLLNRTMEQLRNNLLHYQQKQRIYLDREINTQVPILKLYLNNIQPHRTHEHDIHWINKYDKTPREKLKNKHKRKLEELIMKQQKTNQNNISLLHATDDTSNVVNKSRFNLKTDHLKILSKGLKYVPTPMSLNVVDIITNTENSLHSTPKIIKTAAIAEISNFMTKWKKPTKTNINIHERKLLKEIKCNKDIIVVQADKGGKMVVMDRQEYITKIEEQLYDTKVYENVNDPTNKIKHAISVIAQRLFTKKRINEKQKYDFTSIDNLPTVRGQPKLHKMGTPMRIITCTRSTITSGISRFTFNIIKQLRDTISNCITNTDEFINQINQLKLEDGDNLASLDIKDLFTNVPITQSINIVLERIGQSEAFCTSSLTKSDLKELLTICLRNSYFTFNNKFYRQKSGLPMGNILSPLLSDLYIDEYIKNKLTKINGKLWRYVDDLLIITKMNETDIKLYVEELNSLKESIKFTHEFESNKQLNYLDTTLTKNIEETRIDLKWYRKDTATDRLLHYESCHHKSIKVNIIKNMATRITNITKNTQQQNEDLGKLHDMLYKSKYPKHLIESTIQQVLKQNINKNKNNPTTTTEIIQPENKKNDNTYFNLTLPYVPGIEVLKRKLIKLNIKLYFSYPKKLQCLTTSNIKPSEKSIIYQIECNCGSIYNGETKVGLEARSKQHTKMIEKDDQSTSSEMVQHHHQKRWQCMFDPTTSFPIDNEINYRKRKIKEAIYSTVNNSINKHDNIDTAWNNILHKETKPIKEYIQLKKKQNLSKLTV